LNIKIPYNKKYINFNILDEQIIGILNPREGKVIKGKSLQNIIENAIQNPIGMMPLDDLIKNKSKIVIIIDDNTRPTPTKNILKPLLNNIKRKGIPSNNIDIILALGVHKKLNKEEIIGIVGEEIYYNYRVENHDAFDEKKLIDLGKSTFGTPIKLNKKVYEADLRILTGIIKPHNIAGYTGGGKSILPGVSGVDTVLCNHSFKATSNMNSRLGIIKGNPMREDIEEVSKLIGPSFMVNVVLNYKEEVIRVVTGDVIKAHRKGVEVLNEVSKLNVLKLADICICGTPDPIDINFYQMLNSISAPYRIKRPIIRQGGTIIVAGSAREGISDGDFYNVLKTVPREEIREMIELEYDIYRERAALQIYLEGDNNYKIIVVSEKKNEKLFTDMKIKFSTNLQKTVDEVLKNYDSNENVIVLPYAPYVIPNLDGEP